MAEPIGDRLTQGEAARATGLPRQLVAASLHYFRDGRHAAFDADLETSAPAFHTAFRDHPSASPQHRFAVMVRTWQAAPQDERLRFTMALRRLSRARGTTPT